MRDDGPVTAGMTWYLPHRLVRVVARRMDRGRTGPAAAYQRAVARVETGTADWSELGLCLSVLSRAWWLPLLASVLADFVLIGVVAVAGGEGNLWWLVAAVLSIPPGLLSFVMVFFLHSIALVQRMQDPGDDSRFIRWFILPRWPNLLIIPVVAALGFLAIWSNSS